MEHKKIHFYPLIFSSNWKRFNTVKISVDITERLKSIFLGGRGEDKGFGS